MTALLLILIGWCAAVYIGWIACQRHHLLLIKSHLERHNKPIETIMECPADAVSDWYMACLAEWPDWALVLPVPKWWRRITARFTDAR